MIVGCYVLHLYCDRCDRTQGLDRENKLTTCAEFTGDNKQATLRMARKRGWRLSEQKDTCACPRCVNEVGVGA